MVWRWVDDDSFYFMVELFLLATFSLAALTECRSLIIKFQVKESD